MVSSPVRDANRLKQRQMDNDIDAQGSVIPNWSTGTVAVEVISFICICLIIT